MKTLYTCVVIIKGVNMLDYSSGMGYGMMGMMPMGGMMGTGSSAYGNNGNYWQQLKQEYGCEDCFQHGPTVPECHFRIMPLPQETPAQSLGKRIKRLFGF